MRVARVLLVTAAMLLAILPLAGQAQAANPPVPYDGPAWMARVALMGDSFTWLAGDVFKEELQKEWWRTAVSAYGGLQTRVARDQIRLMASDRPDAFIVELGGNDTLPLIDGTKDWAFEQEQISGVLDDITDAGVPCVVWAGPNEHFDGGQIDYWSGRINAEIRQQLSDRGIGVFADWTPIADAHPEYIDPANKHLSEVGKHVYGQMLANSLRNCSRSPHGRLDFVRGGVGVRVVGWAFDPDTDAPIEADVTIDGVDAGSLTADAYRPDVAQAFPSVSANHGFDGKFALGAGMHSICVSAVNVSYGLGNPSLGCQSVMGGGTPVGVLDRVSSGAVAIRAQGWTIDPDLVGPIDAHVYVDGVFHGVIPTNVSRPDVGAAFPGYGGSHGFDTMVGGLTPGPHQICVYAINGVSTQGGNVLLGCGTASVTLGADPIGAFDVARPVAGGVQLQGWAIDPDVSNPIDVHVYVDSGGVLGTTAAINRPDVGAAFPGLGAQHGFDVTIPALAPGTHQVCVYGINSPATPGGNRLIACRSVAVS